VLFFVSIGTRRVEYVACTNNPDTAWMIQQARNLLIDLDDRRPRSRFLIHDRDTKFSRAFDAVFHSEGIEIVRTPIHAPNANAHAERWVGSVRRECLDRLLIVDRRQLRVRSPRLHAPLQPATSTPSARFAPPDHGDGTNPPAIQQTSQVRRRDLLGGFRRIRSRSVKLNLCTHGRRQSVP
jgi:hypothetical protein